MDDSQLLRYNRQILLPQVDVAGQQKLKKSQVAIIGLGGLGCPAAMYLAGAGIGRLILIDHDKVEITNLQRQLAYRESDIGLAKVAVMKTLLSTINPHCQVTAMANTYDPIEHGSVIKDSAVVLDATDQMASRKSINKSCFSHKRALVFAAAIRMEGQITVFNPVDEMCPCYECIFGHVQLNETCSDSGILGTVVGTLGLMQATEAIKIILNIGRSLAGKLVLYDALTAEFNTIKVNKRVDCPICGNS